MDPFVAQNAVVIFLTVSAFALAGATFFKDTILENGLKISSSFAKNDILHQKKVFKQITDTSILHSSDTESFDSVAIDTQVLQKELKSQADNYEEENKIALETIFEKHRSNTFSFGLFGFGYIYLVSLSSQHILANHFPIYLYTYMYFSVVSLMAAYFLIREQCHILNWITSLFTEFKHKNCIVDADKERIIKFNQEHYRNLFKYLIHALIVFTLFLAVLYANEHASTLRIFLIHFIKKHDILYLATPQFSVSVIVFFYLLITLIMPIFALDKKSMEQLRDYNTNRNAAWIRFRVVLGLKTKLDDAKTDKYEATKGVKSFLAKKRKEA